MKKNPKKEKTTFTAREVAVLVEDFRSQFRVFGEGQKALREEFNGMKIAFKGLNKGVERIDLRLIKVEEDVGNLKGMVAKNTEDITAINTRLGHIEQDIGLIKEDFGKRVSILEAKFSSLNDR